MKKKPNERLRRERQLRGWSQAYLAEQIETSDFFISRWERGAFVPSPYYQQKLCELFGKTAEELGFLFPLGKETSPPETLKVNKETLCAPENVEVKNSPLVNPFTYGNPISDPKRFFGRSKEVDQVFNRLRNAEFESSSIVGERRIGKTSLLKYLAHPVVCQHYGLDPNKYLFVYVDLQVVDENTTPVRLWQRLLRQIASCCSDLQIKQTIESAYQTQSIDNFALQDVFEEIDAKDQYVVLLLDEFERVTENPNFTDAFFRGLRSLAIHHHLSLVTSSRRELVELCHSPAIRSSPFFNIFANINLGLFTKDEALNLISQSLDGTGINFTEAEISTLFCIAGCHPYFLQAACSLLFNAYPQNPKQEERIIILSKGFREEVAGHLAFYWHNSDDHEKIVLMALTLLEGQQRNNGSYPSIHQLQDLYAHSAQTLICLEQRGLVVCEKDTCSLFNLSLGEWIWNEITDTRHNQQSYKEWLAAKKGVTDQFKHLPDTAKQDWNEILPKIKDKYRDLMLRWLAEPKASAIFRGLIKDLLASGWRAPV